MERDLKIRKAPPASKKHGSNDPSKNRRRFTISSIAIKARIPLLAKDGYNTLQLHETSLLVENRVEYARKHIGKRYLKKRLTIKAAQIHQSKGKM